MNKPTKLLLGIATIWPLAYAIFLFVSLFFHFTSMIFGIPKRNVFLELFDTMFIVHLGTMLWIMVLTVFYIVHVIKNPVLKNEMKAIWAAVVFMGSVFAMPVYWYLYVWRDRKEPFAAIGG
jgi:hypothetical protein